jgi:hypothetical protein
MTKYFPHDLSFESHQFIETETLPFTIPTTIDHYTQILHTPDNLMATVYICIKMTIHK